MNQMRYAIAQSMVLHWLGFPLFSQIKKDLPKDYLITPTDIDFLATFNYCTWFTKQKTIKRILIEIWKEIAKNPKDFYMVYCDPYELFIDAWRIDTKLNILI